MNKDDKAEDAPPAKRSKMVIPHEAPPGIEVDSQGNEIPLAQRTETDQERAKAGRKA